MRFANQGQMGKIIFMKRYGFWFTIYLFLLVGCTGGETAVPTIASIAQLPPTNTPLPPTWTPESGERSIDSRFNEFGAQQATPTPTATPLWPTRLNTPTATATATATPLPTATLAPILPNFAGSDIVPYFAYPPFKQGSKLSIHVIRNNDAGILDFVRNAQPAVIKAVDDFGYLSQVKAVSPSTIIIGRVNDIAQNYQNTPEEEARAYVQRHLDQYLANPSVDYWEGWNEPDPKLEWMWWYTRFEQERVRVMAGYNLRTAIGGFATGVPDMDEFELFVPAIETALQYGGILTLHEYGAPDLTYLYGGALPGYPSYPDRGALKFRYRWYYREILEPRGLVIPLAITEAGVDGIIGNRPGPNGLGWQDFGSYWVEQGWGNTAEEAFINQLAWYDRGVQQDPYVIGFTIFTAGGFGYWDNYNINSLLPALTNYVAGQNNG